MARDKARAAARKAQAYAARKNNVQVKKESLPLVKF